MADRRKNQRKRLATKTIEAKALHLSYLFDYGVNFRDRIITLTGEIDDSTFDVINSAMSEMEFANLEPITIRVTSLGGSVYDALAIVGRIKSSPCSVITEGYGYVMSAATIILACADKRRMSKYGWFMHHAMSYSVEGSHSMIKHEVAQSEKEESQWSKAMASFSKKTDEFWIQTGRLLNAYFTSEQMLELGLVDELI